MINNNMYLILFIVTSRKNRVFTNSIVKEKPVKIFNLRFSKFNIFKIDFPKKNRENNKTNINNIEFKISKKDI